MAPDRRRNQMSRGEYSFYFALIFVAALPICSLQWLFTALRAGAAQKDPVRRAWSEAQTITPRIFWA
jgi:hypothetical protein